MRVSLKFSLSNRLRGIFLRRCSRDETLQMKEEAQEMIFEVQAKRAR